MADPRWMDVQESVLEDTFQLLGIDPNNPDAFQVNEPFFNQLKTYFSTPPDQREGPPPSVSGIFTTGEQIDGPSGLEAGWVATMDKIGHELGENQEVQDWAEQAKMEIADQYGDPLLKNRSANLFVQTQRGGNARRQRELLEQAPPGGPAPTPMPTPAPTPAAGDNPYPPGSPEAEAWDIQNQREQLAGQLGQ